MGKRGPKTKQQPDFCPQCSRMIIPGNEYQRYNHKHETCEACRAKKVRTEKNNVLQNSCKSIL